MPCIAKRIKSQLPASRKIDQFLDDAEEARSGLGFGAGSEIFSSWSRVEGGIASVIIREKARSTMFSKAGISDSGIPGCCMSPRLWSQRCEVSKVLTVSRAG